MENRATNGSDAPVRAAQRRRARGTERIMHASIERESPRVIRVRLSGRVDASGWQSVLKDVGKLLTPAERTSILLSIERFEGFEPGTWDDLSFQQEHDRHIGRLAIVGDERWKDRILMFAGKGLRRIEIEFFSADEMEKARRWLTSDPSRATSAGDTAGDAQGGNT